MIHPLHASHLDLLGRLLVFNSLLLPLLLSFGLPCFFSSLLLSHRLLFFLLYSSGFERLFLGIALGFAITSIPSNWWGGWLFAGFTKVSWRRNLLVGKPTLPLLLSFGVFFFGLTNPMLAFSRVSLLPLLSRFARLSRGLKSKGRKTFCHTLLCLLLDEGCSIFTSLIR